MPRLKAEARNMQPQTLWLPSLKLKALAMWQDGKSASEIASALNIPTRNRVIGMIHREGKQRGAIKRQFAMRTKAPGASRALKREMKAPKPPKAPKPIIAKAQPMPEKPKPVFLCEPVTLMDLTAITCRYPVSGEGGDTLFCATPAGEVYCADHQKICWVPILRKMARDTERAVMRLSR